MIRPKLHHVTFKTTRLDEMVTWYETVIGAKVQFRDRSAAWTTNDAANHRIAFLAVPGLSDDERRPLHRTSKDHGRTIPRPLAGAHQASSFAANP